MSKTTKILSTLDGKKYIVASDVSELRENAGVLEYTINGTDWVNSQGPQGATGAQGNDGAQGDQGDQGATGAQGANGAQGDQGDQGATGPQGANGAQGDQGDQGATGPQGANGISSTNKTITLVPPIEDDNITIMYSGNSMSINSITGIIRGGTSVIISAIRYASDRSTTGTNVFDSSKTVDSTTNGSTWSSSTDLPNKTISSGNFIWIEIGTITGSVTELSITINYDITGS